MSDVGMSGDYNSVIGMAKDEPLSRFLRRISSGRFEVADGPATLCGFAIETDDATGLARRVERGSNRSAPRGSATPVLGQPGLTVRPAEGCAVRVERPI